MFDIALSMRVRVPDGYNWSLDRRVYLKSADELEYVVGLIEQSYKNVL